MFPIPDSPKKICEMVRSAVAYAEQDGETRIVETQVNEGFYRGIHWVRFDRDQGRMYRDRQLFNGVIRNYVRFCVDTSVATMTQQRFVPEVYSAVGTAATNRAAEVGTIVLGHAFRQNGGQAEVKRFIRNLAVRGNGFKRVELDDTGINTVVLDPIELEMAERRGLQIIANSVRDFDSGRKMALVRSPRIVERDVSPTCVGVQNGITRFSDATWFTVTSYQPLDKLRKMAAKMGSDPDKLRAASINDIRRPGEGGYYNTGYLQSSKWVSQMDNQESYMYGAESNLGKLGEFWAKMDDGTWYVLYCANDGFDLYLGYEGPFVQHPYVHFRMWDQPSLFWGMSHQADLLQPNTMINKMLTVKVNYFQRAVKNAWIVPRNSQIVGISDSLGDYMVSYDGAGGVQYIQVSHEILAALGAEIGETVSSMMQLARISEISRGVIPDRTSRETVAMALRNDASTLEEALVRIQESYCQVWEKELYLARTSAMFDLPTLLSQVGQGRAQGAMEFRDADMYGDTYLEAKPGAPRLATASEIAENARQLWAEGFFADGLDGPRKRYEEYRTSGVVSDTTPEVERFAVAEAGMENMLFREAEYNPGVIAVQNVQNPVMNAQNAGMVPPVVPMIIDARTGLPIFQTWQLHPIHMEEHMKLMQDPSVSLSVKQLVQLHIQTGHAAYMQQEEEAQKMAALALEAEQSKADAAGNRENIIVAGEVKAITDAQAAENAERTAGKRDEKKLPSTPRQGGINSGKARSAA